MKLHSGRRIEELPEAEVDLAVAGHLRYVMRRPNGAGAEARGDYTLIDGQNR